MKSALPKVLHPLAGVPMIRHVLAVAGSVKPARTLVVIGPAMAEVAACVAPAMTVVQDKPKGTGHAVMAARAALRGFTGDVLVLYGDTPLLMPETLKALLRARRARRDPAVVVLGFRPADAAAYGRLIRNPDGSLERIVEFKDANPAERAETLCNAGAMAIDGRHLFKLLDALDDRNANGEFYLTDIVAAARRRKLACAVVEASADEVLGVNARDELAYAESILQDRLRRAAMANGATLVDPASTWFSLDTKIGRDVVIEPQVFFGPGVRIADNVRIRAFSHLEGATVASGAIIGPYARLRPGANVAAEAHIGNFVEIKNASVETGAKVNHLTYIGDARVGAGANIWAGTITCNYDGFDKHHTDIGAGAFIGSNSALVAPVKIGDGAIVGAGSVITRDVPAGALAVERGKQMQKEGFATTLRQRKRAAKSVKG